MELLTSLVGKRQAAQIVQHRWQHEVVQLRQSPRSCVLASQIPGVLELDVGPLVLLSNDFDAGSLEQRI